MAEGSLQSAVNKLLAKPFTIATKWQWAGCAVLGILCLVWAMQLALLIFVEPTLPQVRFPAAVAAVKTSQVRLYPDSPGQVAVSDELSEASFNGKLLGVIHSEDRSLASISVQGKKEKIYKVGDELTNGVSLEAIESHRVVVRERGVLRQITLKSLLDGGTPIHKQGTPHIQGADAPTGTKGSFDGPPGNSPGNAAGHSGEPPTIIATPVLSELGISGLQIDQLDVSLEELNVIRTGDLVVAVDGVALPTMMADQLAIGQLAEREALTITVIRDNQEVTLDVDGELIRSIVNQF